VLSPARRRHACDLKCKRSWSCTRSCTCTSADHAQAARDQSAYRGVTTSQQISSFSSLLGFHKTQIEIRGTAATSGASARLQAVVRLHPQRLWQLAARALHPGFRTQPCSPTRAASRGAVRPSWETAAESPGHALLAIAGARRCGPCEANVSGQQDSLTRQRQPFLLRLLRRRWWRHLSALGWLAARRSDERRSLRLRAFCSPFHSSQLAHEVLANHRLVRTGCP
jgi:hypothetical protein